VTVRTACSILLMESVEDEPGERVEWRSDD
jgi:hypothetical protein